MKKRIAVGIICILAAGGAWAQQHALYSQYMFNLFAINPGYAGSRKAISAVLLHRNQWSGIDGAPKSETFSIHGPIADKNMGLGFNLVNDLIGPSSNLGALLTYAYHLPLEKGKLSMSLRGGIYRRQIDGSLLNYKEKQEFPGSAITGEISPSVDFGLYYYTYNLYAGFTVTDLIPIETKYEFDADHFLVQYLLRHYMLMGGYAHMVNENLVLKPSFAVKYVAGAPVNADVNFSCLLNKMVWLGLSYRTSQDLVFIGEVNIWQFMRIGASYDLGLNDLQQYSNGAFEVFLGADFKISKIAKPKTRNLF
jgi:type IX secretion system PorP/SprF family membrane protein